MVWLMYVLYVYKYGTLKPVKVILRGGRRRTMEGMNQTRVQYMHIWKCHNNPTPVQLLYTNKNINNK
jgi:hypothetical protein